MSYLFADWNGVVFAASVPLLSAWGSTVFALVLLGYANSVANDKFVRTKADPGFPLIGGLKDVGHMQQLGKDSGASMPVVDIIMQHMRQVCSTHNGSCVLRLACTAIALHLGTACVQHAEGAVPTHVCMPQPLPSCSVTCIDNTLNNEKCKLDSGGACRSRRWAEAILIGLLWHWLEKEAHLSVSPLG